MEPNNLISGIEITLSNRGLPEEQIRRAISELEPGERVFIHCSNVYPTIRISGLEGISYSYWYNPNLVYVWLTSNTKVRELWKAEHRIVAQELRGGTK